MRPHRPLHLLGRSRGLSLIELMVAVVVVSVLAAVAFPSFMDYIRKGRRAEAFSALAAVQQAQERYRGNNPSYATAAELTAVSPSSIVTPTRPGGFYALTIATPTATGYVVTADGSSSSQSQDGNCAILSVQVAGGQIQYGSCKSCSTFTYAARDACWN